MKATSLAAAALASILIGGCGSQPEDSTSAPAAGLDGAGGHAEATAPLTPLASRPLRADGLLPGMVPFRGGDTPYSNPICPNPQLSYFGGPLLQSPIIIAVFWTGTVNATLQANIGQFYADVTLSPYWSFLHEYDSVGLNPGSNQAILPGTFGGGFVITPLKCAPGGNNCHITDNDVQVELKRQINLGVLPAPQLDCTGNVRTIYMVDFPHNISLGGPGGFGSSCSNNNGFCAYHNTGTYGPSNTPLVYGANMDNFTGPCSFGCGNDPTPLDNATEIRSHELVEATTDADIGLDFQANYAFPAAWGDNNNNCGEIGDICADGSPGDTITVAGHTWYVQEMWSNQQNKCTSTGPAKPICSGTTVANCRKCSCGDNGGACSGGTPVCETSNSNVLYGACEQCTATSGNCPGAAMCQQSATPAQDDICFACVPATTCPAGDNCGTVSDGCGGTINCGTCSAPQTCGGGAPGVPNHCGCTPATTCPAGFTCGTAPDGCGGTISCGTCSAPQTCGGGSPSNPNQCGCTPTTTSCPAGFACGTVPNGCGGTVSCGTCMAPQICGGGTPSDPHQCGCTPLTACPAGTNCGTISDGCSGTLNCGTCMAPQTCGGGNPGTPNHCGCTPATTCPAGFACGTAPDGCGGLVNCGTCAAPQTCGGGSPGNPNQCGCTALKSCPAGDDCGTVSDGCGGMLSCGSCMAPQTCGGGAPGVPNHCGCTPLKSCPAGDNCGTMPDGCGGVLSCGTCAAPQICGGGSPGNPNQCGCSPIKSCPAGDNCGTVADGCGGVLSCGTCAAPQTCGGGSPGNPNQCGCSPLKVCPDGDTCGTVADGCGGVVACGKCGPNQVCSGNQCISTTTTSSSSGSSGVGGAASTSTASATSSSSSGSGAASSSVSAGVGGSGAGGAGGGEATSTSTGQGAWVPLTGRAGCFCGTAPGSAQNPAGALLAIAGLAGLGLRRRRARRG